MSGSLAKEGNRASPDAKTPTSMPSFWNLVLDGPEALHTIKTSSALREHRD